MNETAARDRVLQCVKGWRAADFAATVGALSVMPENAHHAATLETLSLLATTTTAAGSGRPTRDAVKQLLSLMRQWTAWGDDPFGTTHTAATTFFGGSAIFFPSDASTNCALRCAYKALAQLADNPATSDAIQTLFAIAQVSNEVVRRCGYARRENVSKWSPDIQLPAESKLRRLRGAVTFERAELERLLGPRALSALHRIVCEPHATRIPMAPFMEDDQPLERAPIVRIEGAYIVVAPRLLDRASLHYLWEAARQGGFLTNFNVALHIAAGTYVDRLFRLFGADSAHPSPVITFLEDAIASQFGYRVDSDKVLCATLVTENPCAETPIGTSWSGRGVADFFRDNPKTRQRPILEGQLGQVRELDLVLATVRPGNVSFERSGSTGSPLVFKLDEFESIALSEAPNASALLLWKFADHLDEVERTTDFAGSQLIDVYSLWRRDGRDIVTRLGIDNASLPDGVFIQPGMARDLRETAAKNADIHGEDTSDGEASIEVICAEGESGLIYVPLYAPTESALVECGGLKLWLTSEVEGAHTSTIMLGRALGYWASYLRGTNAEFRRLTTEPGRVTIRIRTTGSAYIKIEPGQQARGDERPFEVVGNDGEVHVDVFDAFWASMSEADNRLEVELASTLFHKMLLALSREPSTRLLPDLLLVGGTDPHRRMLHTFDTRVYPELTQRAQMPRMRPLDEADIFRVRRSIGARFSDSGASRTFEGPHAATVINELVSAIEGELSQILRDHDAEATLKTCLEQVESHLIREKERSLMMRALLACGTTQKELEDRYHSEWMSLSNRATASRFLVEYVAGQLPQGRRRISGATYDYCLALANEIIALGSVSDVAHFELGNVSLTAGPFGYSVDASTYTDASGSVGRDLALSLLPWRRGATERGIEIDDLRDELYGASREEFGISLRDLSFAEADIMNIALHRAEGVVVMDIDEFKREMRAREPRDDAFFKALFNLLSLETRTRFSDPPPGLRHSELWPWKTNRAYSYIRRPIIVNGATLMYTAGHVYKAARYIWDLCIEGRLKATTPRMKGVMSKLVNRQTDAFNDHVAKLLEEGGYRVKTRVSRFGTARLIGPDGDLGDIDVLAYDAAQREVWLLECKDMSIGRSPHEVHNDLQALFIDGASRSAQTKVLTRKKWVDEHIDTVAASLGTDPSRLSVRTAFVLSRPLISPILGSAAIPVVVVNQLKPRFALRPIAR